MRLMSLLVVFVILMLAHVVFVVEAFGSQPGTQIQMNASRPFYRVVPMITQ
jgi:hypothetical protein